MNIGSTNLSFKSKFIVTGNREIDAYVALSEKGIKFSTVTLEDGCGSHNFVFTDDENGLDKKELDEFVRKKNATNGDERRSIITVFLGRYFGKLPRIDAEVLISELNEGANISKIVTSRAPKPVVEEETASYLGSSEGVFEAAGISADITTEALIIALNQGIISKTQFHSKGAHDLEPILRKKLNLPEEAGWAEILEELNRRKNS